jgi:hypothetical protein
MLHQILHITMVKTCCSVLEQKDTMFKQFWLFTANRQPYIIPQECVEILATGCRKTWHVKAKRESISAEEQDKHDFQSNLIAPCNFLPR